MIKRFLAEYLNFTRKERTGIISILVLIIFFLFLPFFFPYFIPQQEYDELQFEKEIQSLTIIQQDSTRSYVNNSFDENKGYDQPYQKHYYSSGKIGELFYFDPNTLPVQGWKRLGIREKTALTIQKYINKGGRFYKPEDIGKIWGLHKEEVSRLLPYIRIEKKIIPGQYSSFKTTETFKVYEKAKTIITNIDINKADTSTLITLPGIGSKLAARIIAFRDKLGGFYKVDQVAETYALPDSTFQKIKNKLVISTADIKKLNINVATVDELKVHPYLKYNIANAIVQYRIQHGNFASVNEIKKIMMITDDIFNKITPYLTSQ